MMSWIKYWARFRVAICVAVAFGVLLLPVPSVHAEIMNISSLHDMSAEFSKTDHQSHSASSDARTVLFDDISEPIENHHDEQCSPASCLSLMLSDPFANASPKKSKVQRGLKSHALTSVDTPGILRPPLT
ncbi:MAG: hypothetical protein HRU33_10860 [Rhodobacteraceae bacterium]|nr:hypothetical protein [Paracoccaceae bacterium]